MLFWFFSYNDFKITDRYKNIAEYIYSTTKTYQASDSDDNDSGHKQGKADEKKSEADSRGNTIKHTSDNRDVRTELQESLASSESREMRNFYQYYKRQIPIYADYWDFDDDGSADDTDDGEAASVEVRKRPVKDAQKASNWSCDGDKRIVAYYTSWSPNEMSGSILEKVTHVVYSFLIVQPDGTVDFDSPASQERLQRLMELRNSYPQVKIMFAVGGATNSQHFSAITASSETRSALVAAIVRLTGDNGLLFMHPRRTRSLIV